MVLSSSTICFSQDNNDIKLSLLKDVKTLTGISLNMITINAMRFNTSYESEDKYFVTTNYKDTKIKGTFRIVLPWNLFYIDIPSKKQSGFCISEDEIFRDYGTDYTKESFISNHIVNVYFQYMYKAQGLQFNAISFIFTGGCLESIHIAGVE